MAANHGAGVGILGESVIALPPRAAGGGVGHSPQARDQVLFGQLLIDVLVVFLTPHDLGGLARTCKAGAAAVYDGDGRSVAVSLSLKTKSKTETLGYIHPYAFLYGGGKKGKLAEPNKRQVPVPFITASMACHVNLSALRFVHITRSGDTPLIDDNTILQIQQTLGANLEVFSFKFLKPCKTEEVLHL